MQDDNVRKEISEFLLEFAEKMFVSFPPNENQPRNLMTAYFECVLYLVARMDLLLNYLGVDQSDVEALLRVVLRDIEEEFGTANSGRITETVAERMAQYEDLFASVDPFTERWYERVFSFFAHQIDEAMDDQRRYIWSIAQSPEGARLMPFDQIQQAVQQAEIAHVVTFQRVIINYFASNDLESDDENDDDWEG